MKARCILDRENFIDRFFVYKFAVESVHFVCVYQYMLCYKNKFTKKIEKYIHILLPRKIVCKFNFKTVTITHKIHGYIFNNI